jgi:sulfite dehydrogenase (cytochrome) subunit B
MRISIHAGPVMQLGLAAAFLLLLSTALASQMPQRKAITLPEDNAMAALKPGPGLKTVQVECGMCHSTDYIVRQPRKDANAWKAEVKKMRTVYGAPISPADEKTIDSYLTSVYAQANQKSSTASSK